MFPYGDVRFELQDGRMVAPCGIAIERLGDDGDDMVVVCAGVTKSEFENRKGCEEDVAVAEQAAYFVNCMEERSPLALAVMYAPICSRSDEEETLHSCMEREKRSQMKLLSREDGDFVRWAKSGAGVGLTSMPGKASLVVREREEVFGRWRHWSLRDVEVDEVAEILGN